MKRLIFMIMLIFASSMVLADAWEKECTDAGFDFGIAKYQCQNTSADEGPLSGYTTSVQWPEGECNYANWEASPVADGIISKEATSRYIYYPDSTSGTIYKTAKNEISHITFCGNDRNDVPEFSTVGAVLVTALGMLFIFKRR